MYVFNICSLKLIICDIIKTPTMIAKNIMLLNVLNLLVNELFKTFLI